MNLMGHPRDFRNYSNLKKVGLEIREVPIGCLASSSSQSIIPAPGIYSKFHHSTEYASLGEFSHVAKRFLDLVWVHWTIISHMK